MKSNKVILVDMSATLLHHGHIRLIKKAYEMGKVIVALTTDIEIIKHKGYKPELRYEEREEIINAIRYVDRVIPSPWLIDEKFFNSTGADVLVHGDDNKNMLPKDKLVVFERTNGISSTDLRARVIRVLMDKSGIHEELV